MKRLKILLCTFGSYGDLHPVMALASALKAKGHEIKLATTPYYQDKLNAAEIPLLPLGPWIDVEDSAVAKKLMDPVHGPQLLIEGCLMSGVEQTAADLLPGVQWCDVMVSSVLVFPAPLLAKQYGKPWLSIVLQPMSLMSRFDPPVFCNLPYSAAKVAQHIFKRYPWLFDAFLALANLHASRWFKPLYALYEEANVKCSGNPVFKGQYSPFGTLALFSNVMGEPQPDWPDKTVQPGYLFYDQVDYEAEALDAELKQFCVSASSAPWVFTLGTAAVRAPGEFFEIILKALSMIEMPAVLVCGAALVKTLKQSVSVMGGSHVFVTAYAPYHELFPFARGVMHQGGMGTTMQVIRAGKPHIIVPYGYDQADNAARIERKRLGLVIPKQRLSVAFVIKAIQHIERDKHFFSHAAVVKHCLPELSTVLDEAADKVAQLEYAL